MELPVSDDITTCSQARREGGSWRGRSDVWSLFIPLNMSVWWNTESFIGSFRNMRLENTKLLYWAYFCYFWFIFYLFNVPVPPWAHIACSISKHQISFNPNSGTQIISYSHKLEISLNKMFIPSSALHQGNPKKCALFSKGGLAGACSVPWPKRLTSLLVWGIVCPSWKILQTQAQEHSVLSPPTPLLSATIDSTQVVCSHCIALFG